MEGSKLGLMACSTPPVQSYPLQYAKPHLSQPQNSDSATSVLMSYDGVTNH